MLQIQTSKANTQAPLKPAPSQPVRNRLVQRQCASCSGTPGPSGECEECRKKRLGALQRSANGTAPAGFAPPLVHDVLQSPGQALDGATRASMGARFGHDFSHVRVHTDARAAQSAQAVNALAYTVDPDVVFGAGQYAPHSRDGQKLIAHELAHVIQQSRASTSMQTQLQIGSPSDSAEQEARQAAAQVLAEKPVAAITSTPPGVIRRDDFKPWPGQEGADVPGTLKQSGSVISERIDKKYNPTLMPILLEFDQSKCTLTASMDIKFVNPSDKSAQLSDARFNRLKNRIIEVANEKLNGWMNIQVRDDASCSVCRGQIIKINVVTREGGSSDAATVELRKGTGRADAGHIFEGGDNWFTSLLGGVSDSTLWHESGHIVLSLPDEYPPSPGDSPRPADKINTKDWSVMSEEDSYGRRSVMHPRHFFFMTTWLSRRFSGCKFNLVAEPRPIIIDVVVGVTTSYGAKGGSFALLDSLDIAAGISLEKKRRLRLLVGGYGSVLLSSDASSQTAFLAGALVGLDYSTNRSGGGFALRGDVRLGGAYLTSGVPDAEKNKFLPNLSGTLSVGYAGPRFEAGLTGTAGKIFSPSQKDEPFFMLGLRAAYTF